MAEPMTIAKIAIETIRIVADEEKRNKLILAIVIFVVLFFSLILVPLYLLINPIETIKMIITDDTEISTIENMQTDYKIGGYGELTYKGKFPFPLEQADKVVVTSNYGIRIDPITGKTSSKHTGLDISGVHHDNILVIADGVITFTGIQRGYGNCIEVKHEIEGETFYSFYAHLSQILVVQNQEVTQGQIIAKEGGDPKLDPNPR